MLHFSVEWAEVITSLHKKNIIVLLCSIRKQPLGMLKRIGIVPALIPPMHIFNTFGECEKWLHEHLETTGDLDKIVQDLKTFKGTNATYRL